jgi:hypothetical protein
MRDTDPASYCQLRRKTEDVLMILFCCKDIGNSKAFFLTTEKSRAEQSREKQSKIEKNRGFYRCDLEN